MPKNQIYVNKATDTALTKLAEKKGMTKANALSALVEHAGVGREDVKPVVLLIPTDLLKDNEDGLSEWLETRSAGIINHYYPQG